MDQYRRMHARRLVARDPKFRQFLKDNPKIAAEVYKNTPNPPKNPILKVFFYSWYGISQAYIRFFTWYDSLIDVNATVPKSHLMRLNQYERTYRNPATGFKAYRCGGTDIAGNSWGYSNHY